MASLTTRLSPQLRIAVTPVCNLRCFFCRPEGEGVPGTPADELSRSELATLILIAAEVGFTNVKFTGGEPLLRSDIVDIVSDTSQSSGVTDVQLVTNGTLLKEKARQLSTSGLSSLTLSLDAVTPEIYHAIRGGDLGSVLRGLDAARSEGIPVRINTVISRRNVGEIPGLIAVAHKFDTSLKLLDLLNLKAPEADECWLEQFVPFTEVRSILIDLGATYEGLEPTPGGIGAPLLKFRLPDGLQVVVKDSLFGLYFSPSCHDCAKYPCQDAIISLRVTHNGLLKKCLLRDDNLVSVRDSLLKGDYDGVRHSLSSVFADMTASKFVEGVWTPPIPIRREA